MRETSSDVARTALAIAAELARAGPGERADARRMDAGGSPLFWRMAARHGIARADEEKWRHITKMLAILTPAGATSSIHRNGRRLGAVLADGGDASARLDKPAFSETRLARLMAARGIARGHALERAIRALARAHPELDVTSLAWAVLNPDPTDIARAYYARLDRHDPVSEKDKPDA